MKKKISYILAFLIFVNLVTVFPISASADREIPRNELGIPSPLGYYFAGEYYDMWPETSGGTAGITRWAMDKDGYFTITLEKTGTSPFFFCNAYSGTQARFGGMIVGGGGSGGGGYSDEGGEGGAGGDALIMYWAEPFWNDETSFEYGQFYDPNHTPSGWYINDFLNREDMTVTVGASGSYPRGGDCLWQADKFVNPQDKHGYDGGDGQPTVFDDYSAAGGAGGRETLGEVTARTRLNKNGQILDTLGYSHEEYRQIVFWGDTIWIGKGAYNGGHGSFVHYENVGEIEAMHGHTYGEWPEINGYGFGGKGSGGGGAGADKFYDSNYMYHPPEYPGDPEASASWPIHTRNTIVRDTASGVIILEGKCDLVTIRVQKTVYDPVTNKETDTSLLDGFQYYVHCEEGYIDDFILQTNNAGKAERGGMPLAHYTITEITETDRLKGYVEYQCGPVYGQTYLDSLELFTKPDDPSILN